MPLRIAVALVFTAALGAAAERGSWADVADTLPGVKTRVTEMTGERQSGLFAGATEDAILLNRGRDRIRIEKTNVRRVEVKSGRRRLRNILIGAGIGVALGVVLDATIGAYLRNETGESGGVRAASIVLPAAVLGGIGAALPGYRTVYVASGP